MDISGWIAYWAGRTPGKTALRFEGRSIGYAKLEHAVAGLSGFLRDSGIGRGDRVAYLGQNCPELLELFFACARLGAIFVPLNARMPATELRVFVESSDPRLLVAEEGFEETAAASATILSSDAIVSFEVGTDLEDWAAAPSPVPLNNEMDPSTPVLIAFTSGTTGPPKGAVHTQGGVASNAVDGITALEMTTDDEILAILPMFHVAGLNVLTSPAICVGATVTVHRQFDPDLMLQDIERLGISLTLSAPPMTTAMAGLPAWAGSDLSSLRAVLVGGTVVKETAIRPWLDRSVLAVQGWGMTEVGPDATLVPLADAPRKSLTAGKPTVHTRIRIIDRFGDDLPPGESGEVIVQSPSLMQGYWQNPEATRMAIPDGWLRTGDLGFIDDEGFLHVIDRIKEIIVVGISNVYPADVEAVLLESDDIAEAAVVGLPDDELGEVPVAFAVRAPGASLTEADVPTLFDGNLAPYKRPRHVFFVEAMPRTAVGKIEKKALRALARARLLGQPEAN